MSGLRECPFCGKAPRSGWNSPDVPGMEDCGYWLIECCAVHMHGEDEETAAAEWNTRATPPVAAPDGQMIERFRVACRALMGLRGQAPTVYAEDVETMHDVLRVLESLAVAAPVVDDAMVERIIDRVARENSIDGMDGDTWDRLLVRAALTAGTQP